MHINKAFVFSGGLGIRLRPYTLKTPKPLLKLYDKPIIEYILDFLSRKLSINEITVNTFYLAKQFDYLCDVYNSKDVNLYISEQDKLYLHAGDLAHADKFMNSLKEDEVFLGINGDTLFYLDFKELNNIAECLSEDAPMLVVGFQSKTNPLFIKDNQLIGHKVLGLYASEHKNVDALLGDNSGIQLFHSSIRNYLPKKGEIMDFYRAPSLVSNIISQGKKVLYHELDSLQRVEIGTVDDFKNYKENRTLTVLLNKLS